MKLVMLIDGSKGDFEELVALLEHEHPLLIDTNGCDESKEYDYIINNLQVFSQSGQNIMLARFSGKESIVRNLGDERTEMILALSYNRDSINYTECPADILLDMIERLKKETNGFTVKTSSKK